MADTFDPYHRWLGIRKEDRPITHYGLLGLSALEDDAEVIEGAADRSMAHVRTYQSGPHSALSQKILNELAAAKVCLLNPEKKAAYDRSLAQSTAPPAASPSLPPWDRMGSRVERVGFAWERGKVAGWNSAVAEEP